MEHPLLLDTQRRLAGGALTLAPMLDGTWELPARYGADWRAEYEAVLKPGSVGLTDRSWLGVLELTGRDRQTFLQGMVSNDVAVASLQPGQGRRAAFLDSTGHILADLFVHALPDKLLIETDPRCLDRLAQTLDKYLIMEKVRLRDVSAEWATLALQGERSEALAASVEDGTGGFAVPRRHSAAPGHDLWLPVEAAPAAWERLIGYGAVPVGEEAREVLRVEAGLAAWGRELNETVLLPEAGLDDAVSYTKGCYIGQEIVARIAARGHTNRALRGILLAQEAAVPKPGDTVHLPEDAPEAGREIGRVTSAVTSPKFGGRALALAYVRREHHAPETPVAVHLRQPGGAVFAAAGEVRMPGG
ncbi:MAG: aminomethyltransferase family protein [Armatimonadetes bacterium]|nr:aminomethyltransferase family protein [Armatimonadota bacterium]